MIPAIATAPGWLQASLSATGAVGRRSCRYGYATYSGCSECMVCGTPLYLCAPGFGSQGGGRRRDGCPGTDGPLGLSDWVVTAAAAARRMRSPGPPAHRHPPVRSGFRVRIGFRDHIGFRVRIGFRIRIWTDSEALRLGGGDGGGGGGAARTHRHLGHAVAAEGKRGVAQERRR